MLQVHVVTAANRDLYRDQLDLCFRWRHRIYVEHKRWMPARPDGREVDQYDTDDATYLLAFRDDAFVAASRLRPFSTPTLLGDVFPRLASARGLPRKPTDAEWTRMFVVPGARERGHQGVAAAMCCAVMEYCLDAGVLWLGGIQETYWLPRWMDYGWRVEALGLPEEIDGTSCLAALFEVSPQALAGVRQAAGVACDQIVRIGTHRDFVTGRIQPAASLDRALFDQIKRLPKALP
jgi:acyl-homoserine lactone synthase